ncbi:TPP-requiring enzyme co-localized with fatty acid metabolic genes [[Actinomadura] parvosata subsp. kistnae]|uniref:Acetolactate synthase n=1 Tax=[Actinomadura] parvosata subsp. kistnae TaxID=1909395 RepID=A0A1V0A382_9ACTN|nr:thiamine pyrophosphate-binding protein [Nonomuraea sp. ATCC 55076]AQZ64675.1 acetolactate synthase [Nonomuraea sp. ATCC 55076]SPL98593.1 TPP-requiring enzyme co-localized with fatty acid metabolic genes [Actinomadura parvosata subsp. kistnae]
MIVAEAVGRALAACGAGTVFGVVGSGNFHVTNALVASGSPFVAARHEGGAATMADAYARMSGRAGVVTVHQGPGLTNAMTGLTEAAKSRTPLIVLAGEATEAQSNFHIDQAGLATAVGAAALRVTSARAAVEQVVEAYRVAVEERRTVLLNLPLGVQSAAYDGPQDVPALVARLLAAGPPSGFPAAKEPAGSEVGALVQALEAARRPVFIAGRGARHARRELEELAERTGALLATSAVAKGLFRGSPWDLDVSGGFATPLAAELIRAADLVVAWGCALNMWTTRHGSLISPGARAAKVDLDAAALKTHVPADVGVVGDVAEVARKVAAQVAAGPGYRTPALAGRIRAEGRWQAVPYEDESGGGRIDPRTLTIGLDALLPAERIVSVDSGNFMGYPSMLLDVPDEGGFCFTQAFQSVGLGLATAIGAAVARPDRLPVAALGDGGALMGLAELETVVRLGLPMVIVVYDDEAYGAEVHHFGPHGHPLDTVTFPPADLAAIARGHGLAAVTVTRAEDLAGVAEWLNGPRDRPLLVHAKVTGERGSWWLEEAFKGH